MKGLLALAVFLLSAQTTSEDRDAAEEVRRRYVAFNDAWEKRDMNYIRDFFAHDDDMLLFFERSTAPRLARCGDPVREHVRSFKAGLGHVQVLELEGAGARKHGLRRRELRAPGDEPGRREHRGHGQGDGGVREAGR